MTAHRQYMKVAMTAGNWAYRNRGMLKSGLVFGAGAVIRYWHNRKH